MQIGDLTVLINGCGSIGERHHRVLRELGVRSFFYHDPRRKAASRLADLTGGKVFGSLDEALDAGPDILFELTPTALHLENSLKALKRGCHMFIEKPLADTLEGTGELCAAAENSGKKVMVGFCFRYHPGIRMAKQMVREGAVGKLVSIRAMMGEHFPDVRPDYLDTYYVRYSGAYELVHDLDLALWFAGEDPLEVYGCHGSFADLGFRSPDTVEILLGFPDKTAAVHLDFFQTPRRRVFELMGTEGMITVDFARWDSYELALFERKTGEWIKKEYTTSRDEMFQEENRDFLNSILKDREPGCPLQEGLMSLAVIEKLKKREVRRTGIPETEELHERF